MSHTLPDIKDDVILPTIIVLVQSAHGNFIPARALLDLGSQISIVRRDFVYSLGLRRHYCEVPVTGVGGISTKFSNQIVTLKFKSWKRSNPKIHSVSAVVLKRPTSYIPARFSSFFSHLYLDDQFSLHLSKIDIIFGCDVLGDILEGSKLLHSGGPYALETISDLTVFGPVNDKLLVWSSDVYLSSESSHSSQSQVESQPGCGRQSPRTSCNAPQHERPRSSSVRPSTRNMPSQSSRSPAGTSTNTRSVSEKRSNNRTVLLSSGSYSSSGTSKVVNKPSVRSDSVAVQTLPISIDWSLAVTIARVTVSELFWNMVNLF